MNIYKNLLTSNQVLLFCPTCKRTQVVDKDCTDPLDTVRVHIVCDKCDVGDFGVPTYYNEHGNQLLVD